MYRHIASLLLLSGFSFCSHAQEKRFVFTEGKMGAPFTIIFYHQDSVYAKQLSANAFRLVDSFVNLFSDYIDSSELSKITASNSNGIERPVSTAMFDILYKAQQAYRRSDHAFDITIGPLSQLWRAARKSKRFPTTEAVEERMKLVGFRYIELNRRRHSIIVKRHGMKLDLGGIAQGYIGEAVLRYLQQAGIKSILVDVSGDIRVGDPPPGRSSWVLGVNLPETADEIYQKKLNVNNLAVSTSGDVYQFIEYEGKKYSHIIDPRTGYGVTDRKNITVIANDGATADWLATACSILSVRKGKKLARRMKAEMLAAYIENGEIRTASTKGFEKFWK